MKPNLYRLPFTDPTNRKCDHLRALYGVTMHAAKGWTALGLLMSVVTLGNLPVNAQPAKQESETGPQATASQWPLFRGDPLSTGVAHGELPAKPSLLWKHKV